MFKTIAVAAFAAAAAASPALAKDRAWQIGADTMHIYYDDLDVKTAAGRGLLLRRVERAMMRLCRETAQPRHCVAEAVQQASRGPKGGDLRIAVVERDGVRLAAR